MTKSERFALLRDRHQVRASWLDRPEMLAQSNELPQADTRDLERTYSETIGREAVREN